MRLWTLGCPLAPAVPARSQTPRRSHVTERPSLTVEQTLDDRLGRLNEPIVSNLPAGHVDEQWTLPLGLMAELDTNRPAIKFAECAVE